MPLYEYECPDCQHAFEQLVQTEEPKECPQCQGKQLHKLLSVPAKPLTLTAAATPCNSSGPPCGPRCARY